MMQNFGRESVADMLSREDVDMNTPLLEAVENGCTETTKILLSAGANVNHCNKDIMYPLHLAATIGSIDIIKVLVQNDAKLNCLNMNQQTPLHVAASHNNPFIIEYLLKKGANISRPDKDHFTPLLLAASEGNAEVVDLLIKHGADITVVDKEDKSALYWAAVENHPEVVKVLLKHQDGESLLEVDDRYDNGPLHMASARGFLDIAILLLDAGADIDNKNEDEQTPLHQASKNGKIRIVKELIQRDKFSVNDEDFESNTALHLACMHGHYKVLDVGIQADAPIDPMDKNRTTPLHLAARYGHDGITELLIDKGASVRKTDLQGRNSLAIAITLGNRDVVTAIIESSHWKEAFRNEFFSRSGVRQTPIRLLIKKFPDLAKLVFDKCISTNMHSMDNKGKTGESKKAVTVSPDDPDLTVTMDYELIDDAYSIFNDLDEDGEDLDVMSTAENQEVWDDNGKLLPHAKPYTDSSIVIKQNHPLMIMVHEKRTDLLGHPLCMALVRQKWNSFGRYIYYIELIFYFIFVISVTVYMELSPRPYSYSELLLHSTTANSTVRSMLGDTGVMNESMYNMYQDCTFIRDTMGVTKKPILTVAQIFVLIFSIIHLIIELVQFIQNYMANSKLDWGRLKYFGWNNILDLLCFILGPLLVIDWTSCRNHTGVRTDWQWQIGAVCVTLCWLNLLSHGRKLPFLGIYVVMFTDVLQTFLKVSMVVLMFVMAFSFGFYALLSKQPSFSDTFYSIIKTFVMTIGEFEFDDLFFNAEKYCGTSKCLPYKTLTLLFFVVFVVIMPIITMNLLVGLAVDDIKAVLDAAAMERLAMQVELNLEVEKKMPNMLKRNIIIRRQVLYPNRSTTLVAKIFSADAILNKISSSLLSDGADSELAAVSGRQLDIIDKIKTIKATVRDVAAEMESTRILLKAIAKKTGVQDLEEDE